MLNFIVNPHAKHARKALAEISPRLKETEETCRIIQTESREQMKETVKRLCAAGERQFVAVGGDGTLNALLESLEDPDRSVLGLIPAGTGNDFAAAARIPFGAAALDLILGGVPKPTDYIACGDMRCMNIAGLGIDVDVLERCYRMKHGSEKGKYIRGLLTSLRKYRGQNVTVIADGERISGKTLIAAVCNGSQFGGGIRLCPPAEIGDGKLDLVVADCPKRWKIPYYLFKLMKGKAMRLPIVKHRLCEEVRIEQSEGTYVQLDGELRTSRILTARVVHGKLQMFRG